MFDEGNFRIEINDNSSFPQRFIVQKEVNYCIDAPGGAYASTRRFIATTDNNVRELEQL